MGYVRHFYEWDWAGAEQAYLRAIELNPRYPTAHQWYAEHLTMRGRIDEALVEIRGARDDDPASLIVNAVEANTLYLGRRYDEAIEQSLRLIDMDPNFPEISEFLERATSRRDTTGKRSRPGKRAAGCSASTSPTHLR